MKKFILALIIAGLILNLCGCSLSKQITVPSVPTTQPTVTEQTDDKSEEDKTTETPEPAATEPPEPADTPTPAPCKHNYTSEVTKEATCTSTGSVKYTCSKCGDSYTETIQKKEHTSVIDRAVEATCAENGCTVYICSVCGQELDRETIPATGHSYENGFCKKCGSPDPNYMPFSPGGNYELPEDEL